MYVPGKIRCRDVFKAPHYLKEKNMPSLSPKENYLRALRHEETEYVPVGMGADIALCGFLAPSVDHGNQASNFLDGYGVRWVESDSAPGAVIPAPGEFLLKDITQWKKTITIPDADKFDWQKFVEIDFGLLHVNPDTQAIGFYSTVGTWERLAALMGFEEAMIAMMEEPEACYELFSAITDFKIKLAEKAAKYYKADAFINFDDIATERNLFMSPDTYRKLIKSHHKRLNDAVRNLGMIPIQHTCGHAEICVADYIETGAEAWSAVQPTNDVAAILDKYGDKFCIEGGFNMNGKPGRPDSTIAEIVAEVERCFHEYGGKKGYIFLGGVLTSIDAKDTAEKTAALMETVSKLRFAGK
jgi:uroporphyrinogen-III decarboxylase